MGSKVSTVAMWGKTLGLASLVICVPSLSVARSDQLYTLRAQHRNGEQHRYSVVTGISNLFEGQKKAIGIEFSLRYTVLSVSPGATKLMLTYDNPHSSNAKLPLQFKPSKIVLDAYNQPIGSSHSSQIFAIMPKHPVKVGDTWTGSYNLLIGASGGALVDVTYKLEAVRNVSGKMIAALNMKLRGMAPGEGTSLVNCKDGTVVSSVMNVRLKDKQQKSYPVQILVRQEN